MYPITDKSGVFIQRKDESAAFVFQTEADALCIKSKLYAAGTANVIYVFSSNTIFC